MVERRKSVRNRCLIGARVIFNTRNSTMSCNLRNFSEGGALLRFGEMPYVPGELEVVLNNRSTLIPAQVRWRRGEMAGVAFPRGRFLRELREDAAKGIAEGAPAGVAVH